MQCIINYEACKSTLLLSQVIQDLFALAVYEPEILMQKK